MLTSPQVSLVSDQKCAVKLHNDESCLREVVPGSEWCIFHYPEKTGELAERFEKAFLEEMLRQEKMDRFFDFTGFDFPNMLFFELSFSKEVYFDKAVFRREVSFGDPYQDVILVFREFARFDLATFEESAYFDGVNFKGGVGFDSTTFKGGAGFRETTFEGVALFNGATFEGIAGFNEATFKGDARFIRTTFKEGAIFDRTTFEESAWFFSATFKGDVEGSFERSVRFTRATFKGDAWFDEVTFKGDAYFLRTTFKENLELNDLQVSNELIFSQIILEKRFTLRIEKWMLKTTDTGKTSIYSVQIRDPIVNTNGKIVIKGKLGVNTPEIIAGISILNTELEKVEFIDETWMHEFNEPKRRKIIIDEILLSKQIEHGAEPRFEITPDQVAQTYRRLRENYEKAKRYSEAGDFLIGEMEVIRKYKPGLPTKNSKRPWYDPTKILFSLYYALGKYGESISRPLLSAVALILLAAEFTCFYTYDPNTKISIVVHFLASLQKTLEAFFPFNKSLTPFDLYMKLVGSLLLALTFIALRRRLERR